jgi:hypothetical protein
MAGFEQVVFEREGVAGRGAGGEHQGGLVGGFACRADAAKSVLPPNADILGPDAARPILAINRERQDKLAKDRRCKSTAE